MPMIGHGQHHSINIIARHHFTIIVIGGAIFVVVVLVDGIYGGLRRVLIQIARGDHAAIFLE